eukprot:2877206-Rhodomonas_salina.2
MPLMINAIDAGAVCPEMMAAALLFAVGLVLLVLMAAVPTLAVQQVLLMAAALASRLVQLD